MRPISKAMLIHRATLCDVYADDYGNAADQQAAALERVRIEPRSQLARTRENSEVRQRLTMFVDARVSLPRGVDIRVGQAVWWQGKRFVVADVQAFFHARGVHHWEVALIGG